MRLIPTFPCIVDRVTTDIHPCKRYRAVTGALLAMLHALAHVCDSFSCFWICLVTQARLVRKQHLDTIGSGLASSHAVAGGVVSA